MLKFALIGNGFIGAKHIEAIKAVGGELVAVCDIDENKKVEGVPFFLDYKEAMKEADCVSICTPNYLHEEMILEAARQGKRILCEKTVSFKLEDFAVLKGIPNLFGNFQLRYLPELSEMRKAVQETSAAYLKVEMKRSRTYYDTWKGDPEKTGGLLLNIGCHYFDLVGHLFGYEGFQSFIEENTELKASGLLVYEKSGVHVRWSFELTDEKPEYERSLTIGEKKFDLVQKENLHINTYKDFMWGHGIRSNEEEKIVKMIYDVKGTR